MKKEISEVFTPRKHEVNPSMYISRPELERELERAVKKNTHILLFGESGNGKSWLYKTVLNRLDIPYESINCGAVSQANSIVSQLKSVIIGANIPVKTGYTETKSAGLKIPIANADLEHEGSYSLSMEEPIYEVFKAFAKKSEKRKILVIENLESIFEKKSLLDELANILILLDDERYAKFNITILIVGTPTGVIEYYSRTKNLESVANRIAEMPKVGGFGQPQVRRLIETGFIQLGLAIQPNLLQLIAFHVHEITLGVAQRVHEYLESLAYEIEDNAGKYEPSLLDKADNKWLLQGLRACYSVVQEHLNSRRTEVARRNQVIYSIGKVPGHSFGTAAIEETIKKEFPETARDTGMGIGPILASLSEAEKPLVIRLAKGNEFTILDPRYLMCIRVMLRKDQTGKVIKRKFLMT